MPWLSMVTNLDARQCCYHYRQNGSWNIVTNSIGCHHAVEIDYAGFTSIAIVVTHVSTGNVALVSQTGADKLLSGNT